MSRRAISLLMLGIMAAGAHSAAAAPPKPISETYKATAPVPDPTPAARGDVTCDHMLPMSKFEKKIKVPSPGTLKVEYVQQTLDWALAVRNSKGQKLASADGGTPEVIEKLSVKLKSAGSYTIDACNFAGGPEATVKYTFTPSK